MKFEPNYKPYLEWLKDSIRLECCEDLLNPVPCLGKQDGQESGEQICDKGIASNLVNSYSLPADECDIVTQIEAMLQRKKTFRSSPWLPSMQRTSSHHDQN